MTTRITDPSPDWLSHAVNESCKTEEWARLLNTINDRVQGHIRSFDLPLFSDMDESSQSALIEKEFKELVKMKSPSLYHYSSALNGTVDQALLMRLQGQANTLQYNVDHLTNICTSAVKDILLNSPPDMANASRIFINRPLPRSLRPFIWSNALGFNSRHGGVHRQYVSRISPLLEVLLSRRCQTILDHFFVKISSRASAALVKTAVSNFMKSHEMPLPVDEEQCACGTPFDHIVFLAVPIMAVLKMFSPTGGHGAAFVHQTAPSVQTQFSDDSNASRPVSIVDGDNRTGHVEGDQDSDSDVKIAVLTAVAALASLTSRRHIGILLTSGTETTISHLLPQVKELLQKKHFDFEYHLCHLSSEHMRELSSSMHAHSAYLSTHLPAVRKRAAHKQQSPTDNSFFDYINFCLLRSFSGSASPEVVIFIMDQCLILGFTVMLPLISTALLLGSSGELLALENCDNAVECFDNYCRVMTVGKLRRLLSAFCAEELTNIYDDEGAYRLLTNEDNVLETMYSKLLPKFSPPPPPPVSAASNEPHEPIISATMPTTRSTDGGIIMDPGIVETLISDELSAPVTLEASSAHDLDGPLTLVSPETSEAFPASEEGQKEEFAEASSVLHEKDNEFAESAVQEELFLDTTAEEHQVDANNANELYDDMAAT